MFVHFTMHLPQQLKSLFSYTFSHAEFLLVVPECLQVNYFMLKFTRIFMTFLKKFNSNFPFDFFFKICISLFCIQIHLMLIVSHGKYSMPDIDANFSLNWLLINSAYNIECRRCVWWWWCHKVTIIIESWCTRNCTSVKLSSVYMN